MEVNDAPDPREHSAGPSDQHSDSAGNHERSRGDDALIGEPISTASSTGASTTVPEPEPEPIRALRAELAHARRVAADALDCWEAHAGETPDALTALRHSLASAPDPRALAGLVHGFANVVGLIGALNMESYPPAAKVARLEDAEYAAACKLLDALGAPRPRRPR